MSQRDAAAVKKIQAGLALLILAVVIVGALVVSGKPGTMRTVATEQPSTVAAPTSTLEQGLPGWHLPRNRQLRFAGRRGVPKGQLNSIE